MKKTSLGLALGGGGARGLAHIGVLKVLENENIPVHYVSGTSMGGIIAAGYAVGLNAAALEEIALEMSDIRNMLRLMDVHPNKRGLMEGKRVRHYLIERMGLDVDFSQLRIPLAVVAVDLARGKRVVLKSGRVIDAVMATSAFPGVFEMVYCDDMLLVDGGMLDNVPASAARELGAQTVIAVSVTPRFPRETVPVEVLQTRLLPPIFPLFTEELYRAAMVMTAEITRVRLEEARPELVLYPEIPDNLSVFLGFARAAEAIAAGEQAARHALPEILKLVAP